MALTRRPTVSLLAAAGAQWNDLAWKMGGTQACWGGALLKYSTEADRLDCCAWSFRASTTSTMRSRLSQRRRLPASIRRGQSRRSRAQFGRPRAALQYYESGCDEGPPARESPAG